MEAISQEDVDILERVQKRATKMMPSLRNVSYEMCLKSMLFNKTRNQDIERRSDRSVLNIEWVYTY